MGIASTDLVYVHQANTDFWANADGGGGRFSVWAQGIRNMLLTAGASRTADTGQIDPTVIPPKPTATGPHYVGYEMYQFTDALQSTAPIFIRVDYRYSAHSVTGATIANYAHLLGITVGQATDGAGNLVGDGVTSTRFFGGGGSTSLTSTLNYNTADYGVARRFLASCGPDRFFILCAEGQGGYGGYFGIGSFAIERTRSASSGLPTDRGWVSLHYGSGTSERNGFGNVAQATSTAYNKFRNQFTSGQYNYDDGASFFLTPPASSIGFTADLDIALLPCVPYDPLPCGQAALWLAYSSANFPQNEEHIIEVNGQSANYRFMGGSYVVPGGMNYPIAIKWE